MLAAGLALALGLGAVALGCTSEDDGGASPATMTSAPGASWSVQVGGTSPGELLAGLALAESDGHDGERLVPALDGDQLGPVGTIRHCGSHLQADEARTARYEADLLVGGRPLVTSEAIRYRPGMAETAMDELRQLVATCPQGVPQPDPLGAEPRSYTSEPIPDDLLAGVADDHVALYITTEVVGGDGADARQVLVVQRRGDVLVATSGYGDEARILAVAAAAGARLAAADPAEVGD